MLNNMKCDLVFCWWFEFVMEVCNMMISKRMANLEWYWEMLVVPDGGCCRVVVMTTIGMD